MSDGRSAAAAAAVIRDPARFVPASRGSRAAAFLIDYVPTVVIASAVVFPLLVAAEFSDTSGFDNEASAWLALLAAVLIPLVSCALSIALMRSRGYTLGKRILGLRVVNVETGAALTTGKATLRVVALFLPVAVGALFATTSILMALALPPICWAVMIATTRPPLGQGVQDRFAGSVVVGAAPLAEGLVTPGGALQ